MISRTKMKLSKRGVDYLKKNLKTAIEVGAKDRAEWEDSYYLLKDKKIAYENPALSLMSTMGGWEGKGEDVPESFLEGLEQSIKYSELKEKFMRYAHNWNYEKAEKYHKKTLEWEQAQTERFCENIAEKGKTIVSAVKYHTNLHGYKTTDERSGEGGYLQSTNEYKKNYEFRLDILSKLKDNPEYRRELPEHPFVQACQEEAERRGVYE